MGQRQPFIPEQASGVSDDATRPPVPDRIADEQLRMIWAHARPAVLVASLFAVALCVALRGVVAPAAMVDGWLAVKLLVSVIRGMQGWQVARLHRPEPRWMGWSLAGLVADGAVWGFAGLYVAITAPWPLASFIGAVMACLACVATFGLQVSARFTAGYAMPVLAPTALGLFMREEVFGQLGSLGMLLLLGLQLATAVRSQKRLEESIQLRMEAQALAHEKAEALKVAIRQSAVRTQFLANISHELRTPLHGILGMASLLQPVMHDPTLARRVELIASSGSHLLSLINDLLDISRIDAGKFLIRKERYDLAEQVAALAGIYAMRCEEKGLSFGLRSELPSPCWVMGDPARFRQVLHNLLGNAVKFTAHGAVSLVITRDEASGLVRAEVHDTGPGIPQADLGKVFEAFHQSESGAAAQPTDGAGLGLTIARDIARAMGGDIVAFSRPGAGAVLVFTALLPGAPQPETEQPALDGAPQAAADPVPTAPALSHTCLTLLAEDNEINALVAANFLEIIGVETERVKDGQEAVREALREHQRPDLILMDCQMPVMNGYEATRAIRTQEQARGLPRIPIVALTATASDTERQDCLDAGMDDFLSKPCTIEDLNRAIKRWAPTAEVTPSPKPQEPPPRQPDGVTPALLGTSSATPGAPLPT